MKRHLHEMTLSFIIAIKMESESERKLLREM
jgi:hypothetical protein